MFHAFFRRRAAVSAVLAAALTATTPGLAQAAWKLNDDQIGHHGVAENISQDGAAAVIIYCARTGSKRPTFALNAGAITAYGQPREAWIRIVGPEGSAPPDPEGQPQREELLIDGKVHSRGDGGIFLADIAAAGFYHSRLKEWPTFDIVVGRTRYAFDGANGAHVTEALGSCLYW